MKAPNLESYQKARNLESYQKAPNLESYQNEQQVRLQKRRSNKDRCFGRLHAHWYYCRVQRTQKDTGLSLEGLYNEI